MVVTGAVGGWAIFVIMIQHKHIQSETELPHLRGALDSPGFIPRAGQRRKQQRRQNGDNSDYHQQLD